ncbi:hypothetical protein M2166_002770 [Bacillus sp. TBS-096]|nr:hypothetical protein [Bacillus sp. TBS-096]
MLFIYDLSVQTFVTRPYNIKLINVLRTEVSRYSNIKQVFVYYRYITQKLSYNFKDDEFPHSSPTLISILLI